MAISKIGYAQLVNDHDRHVLLQAQAITDTPVRNVPRVWLIELRSPRGMGRGFAPFCAQMISLRFTRCPSLSKTRPRERGVQRLGQGRQGVLKGHVSSGGIQAELHGRRQVRMFHAQPAAHPFLLTRTRRASVFRVDPAGFGFNGCSHEIVSVPEIATSVCVSSKTCTL